MASTICQPEVPGAPLECVLEEKRASSAAKASYAQILKSSALIGGSQLFNVVIGIMRTKATAILLGPAGFGLAGMYNSIVDLTQSIAGMGVNSSGVRQIAHAQGSADTERIALTTAVLRRISVVLGIVGALVVVVFCRQISKATFGTTTYSAGVAALSIAAFCKLVSGGQGALVQGMRRIADLAKMNVLGALFGAVTSILLVYLFRENGIVPYIVSVAAMSVLTSWWYSRKVKVKTPHLSYLQLRQEARELLKLGFAFMISSLMTLGVPYGVRVMLLHRVGLQATGFYQSAWTLGGLYVGFILQAMAADFYPRLTGAIDDHRTCNRLVNEQARVGLLLAGPGVIVTLVFAPVVVMILYSAKFGASVPILRWICLGALVQVISWPMGFIIVAKGKQNLFIFSEVAWAIASMALAWGFISYFGAVGAGIAFFASYIFHALLTYAIASRLTRFCWSDDNLGTGLLFSSVIALVFCALYLLPSALALTLGSIAAIVCGVYSVRVLLKIIPVHELPRPLRQLLARAPAQNLG